jgi:hypothetical protein
MVSKNIYIDKFIKEHWAFNNENVQGLMNDLLLHPLSSGDDSIVSGCEQAIDTYIAPAKVEDTFTSGGES